MLDMTLAGLGSSMVPLMLAAPSIAEGRLIELDPQRRVSVTLYLQRTRLAAQMLDRLTHAVRGVAVATMNPNFMGTGRSKTD